ncbi:uncharacterized protein PHALS_06148 [Plasmopara halstedii]|uniref:Uncharacterized protein n=1 Tax=Plasmopara halstedii TaxID=4781 RepID=A0A0P1B0Q4_PLAHL|nr:uncharacterized protein PHALS_06148 [Plasmopara halstedii]CEG48321.1 hypothetical protein PHALS_06148 [Plasmopara halstedii]|eukprot:XP_024584690.1 hypothetical protein PHALS_06148 [Plasmopara halstedii]
MDHLHAYFRNGLGEQSSDPATIRLERAMKAHATIQTRTTQQMVNKAQLPVDINPKDSSSAEKHVLPSSVLSQSSPLVEDLATQFQNLWQHEMDQQQQKGNNNQYNVLVLKKALVKIGPREKDSLLLYLLEQQGTLRTKCSEVATLGEEVAAQLINQQHELHRKFRTEISELMSQLHDALYFNPQVTTLQAKVEELEESICYYELQLRIAVQKLQRSRKRVKELKHMNDCRTNSLSQRALARFKRQHAIVCTVSSATYGGATAAKSRVISATTLASNQAMLERLFGSDEIAQTQVLQKKKMDLYKSEYRRNARSLVEKQLQAGIESYITRASST